MVSKPLALTERIRVAMELGGKTPADLAKACGISRAAVSKWGAGKTRDLRNAHLFAVAKLCRVDPEWLGTGHGSPKPARVGESHPPAYSGLTEMGARVGRKWQALDEPGQSQVLMLIETLGALQSENYRKWGIEQQRIAKTRKVSET